MHIEEENIVHIEDGNIVQIEDVIFLGTVNKFAGETSQRGSSNTNDGFQDIEYKVTTGIVRMPSW